MESEVHTPQEDVASYRDRMVAEVQGYIDILNGDNFFREHLEKLGVCDAALESYYRELEELGSLPPYISDYNVRALHQEYEENRKNLLE